MIVQNSYLQKGLIHHFPLSQIITRVDDASTFILDHETLLKGVGTAITYGEDVRGRTDMVSVFNGTTSKVTYSSIPYTLVSDLTIAVRLKADSFGESSLGIVLSTSKLIIQLDGVDDYNRIKVSRDGATWAYMTQNSFPLDQEVFLLITSTSAGVTNIYSRTDDYLFQLMGDADQSAGTPVASTDLILGNNVAGDRAYEGYLKDVLIWNWILNDKTMTLASDILIS